MGNEIRLVEARNYLIKGCAAQIYRMGDEFPIDKEGPVDQRRFQIVDAFNKVFRSQRHKGFNRLALVQPELVENTLTLRANGMPDCVVDCDHHGDEITTVTWEAEVLSVIQEDASRWISEFMGKDLLFVQKIGDRPINSEYAPANATIGFADRFPLTSVSQETIDKTGVEGSRFRYNLLFSGCNAQDENRMARFKIGTFIATAAKPCGRCPTINVNQDTGEIDMDLLDELYNNSAFRNPYTSEVVVSENNLIEQPGVVRVGSPVEVLEWSDEGWDRPYNTNHKRQQKIIVS